MPCCGQHAAAVPVALRSRVVLKPVVQANDPDWRMAICEVHRRLEKDDSTPRLSRFCRFCDAWICQGCWNDLGRRARAMLKGAAY